MVYVVSRWPHNFTSRSESGIADIPIVGGGKGDLEDGDWNRFLDGRGKAGSSWVIVSTIIVGSAAAPDGWVISEGWEIVRRGVECGKGTGAGLDIGSGHGGGEG